jgi:hypothetical protein
LWPKHSRMDNDEVSTEKPVLRGACVSACVCVCVCVCAGACVCTCVHACMHACVCVCMCVCVGGGTVVRHGWRELCGPMDGIAMHPFQARWIDRLTATQ